MKNKVMSAAALLLFSCVGVPLVIAQTHPQSTAPVASMPPPAPWEYKSIRNTIGSTTSLDRELNRLGAEGWELCLFDETRTAWVFKRPKR